MFRPGRPAAAYPVTRLGYMEVAQVEATPEDGTGPPVGALVAMTYGHRTGYAAPIRYATASSSFPPNWTRCWASTWRTWDPICANGLLHAAVEVCGTDVRSLGDGVRGLRVVVVGGGVIGLLTALFATHHGAAEVVVLDPTPQRRAAAEQLGLRALDPDNGDPAVALKSRWRHTTGDRGADVVFQCRGRTASLALALRLLRPQGTVIDLAFYTDNGTPLQLGSEFHHNGLSIRCAQIGRVPRGTAHVWDRERLSAETISMLTRHGPAIREHVITDIVRLDDGPRLLTDLAERRRHVIQAVLTP